MGSNPASGLISVVITTRNEALHLGQLLESLRVQEPPFEIVLVDSESRDRTVEIAHRFSAVHPDLLTIIERPGSRGIGRNIGVRAARGEFIAFIDGDCFAEPQWLHRLRGDLRSSAVVAGRTITVTELDGRRIARLRVTASQAASQAASPAAPVSTPVSPGQVRLDSEARQDGDPIKSP